MLAMPDEGYEHVLRHALSGTTLSEWRAELVDLGAERRWLSVAGPRPTSQAQGWKLHVSSDVASAEDVLRAVVGVLRDEMVDFKVAATPAVLRYLNSGRGGPSQT